MKPLALLFADRSPAPLALAPPSAAEAELAGMADWRARAKRKASAEQLRAELATFEASAEPPAEAAPLVLEPTERERPRRGR